MFYHPLSSNASTPPLSLSSPSLTLDDADEEEEDLVTAISATPSSRQAIVAHRSGRLRVYSLPPSDDQSPSPAIRPFSSTNLVSLIAVHPAGQYFAVGAADGTIRVLDIDTLSITHSFDAPNGITVLEFAPGLQSTQLVAGCGDGSICIFNLEQSKQRKKKKGKQKKVSEFKVCQPHVARVTGITFVSKSTMVTCALDHVISAVNIQEGESELKPKLFNVGSPVNAIATIKEESSNGSGKVIIASSGKPLRVWDVARGIEDSSATLEIPFVNRPGDSPKTVGTTSNDEDDDDDDEVHISVSYMTSSVSKEKSSSELIIALSDSTILRARANYTSNLQMSLLPNVICGYMEEVYDVATIPNQSDLQIAVASNSPIVWVMSPAANNSWRCKVGLRGHTENILSISISGNLLASASRDGTVRVWRMDREGKWECVGVGEGHTEAISAVAIAPRRKKGNNDNLVMASGGSDRTLKVWPLKSILKRDSMEMDAEEDKSKPEEDSDHCDIVDVWDKSEMRNNGTIENITAKWTALAHEKDINTTAISPDGNIVATGSQDRSVKLWKVANGELVHIIKGHKRGIWSVAFSNVDRVLASASGDGSVKIWSVQSGTCLRTMEGHSSGVVRVAFLSRGTQVVSGGSDGVIKAWSTKTGECDVSVEVGRDRVWGLNVVDEGDKVITGDGNGRVVIWNDGSEQQLEEKRQKRENENRVEQAVGNAERVGSWSVAVKGALELGTKERLKQILTKLIEKVDNVEFSMKNVVREVFNTTKEEDKKEGWGRIGQLVMCCREWQAVGGSRNAVIASYLLQAILSSWTVDELTTGVLKLGKITEGRAVVEGLDAHCGRHVERANRMVERVAVMEHILVMMRGGVHVADDADTAMTDVDASDESLGDDAGVMAKKKKTLSIKELQKQKDRQTEEVMARKRKRREEVDCEY